MGSDASSKSNSSSSVSFSRSSSIGSDGWEFVDWARKSGKELFFKELHFDEKVVLEMDYFDCPACTSRGPAKPAGEKPPCTCSSKDPPSIRSPRAPSKRFRESAVADMPPQPMIVPGQDSISQVLFMKSFDQENKFVSLTMISPRSPAPRDGASSPEPLKESNFYAVNLMSPRTPRIHRATPAEPDQTREKKLTRMGSRRPPRSPSSKWLNVPPNLEPSKENRSYYVASLISPRSPGRMPYLLESPSMKESASIAESLISPRIPPSLRLVHTNSKLDSSSLEEDDFPGFPPTSDGVAKSDAEPEQELEKAYVGLGALSPRPNNVIEGLSPVAASSDDEEKAEIQNWNENGIEEELPAAPADQQEAPSTEEDQKKKNANETGHHMLGGIGALASIGVAAAATVAVLMLGGGGTKNVSAKSTATRCGSSRQKRNKERGANKEA